MTRIIRDTRRTKLIKCISSETEDKYHVLFWDFDNIKTYDILKSLSKTQHYNGLGVIFIIQSKHGFNAVCLDRFTLKEAFNILDHTKYNDYFHTHIGYSSESWSLRTGGDKKYWRCLYPTDSYKNHVGSMAHKLFMESYFDLDIRIGEYDQFKKLRTESYAQNVI